MTIKYSNWPETETDDQLWGVTVDTSERKANRTRRAKAVQAALGRLPECELFVVRQRHFDGRTFAEIAKELHTSTQSVVNQYNRALRRLKKLLAGFVEAEFGVEQERSRCTICCSPARSQIEGILALRKPGERLGPFMREIRSQFGLRIISPMTIVAHVKYHS